MPYLNVAEVESALAFAAATYPATAQLITLPNQTWEGRTCHAVKIGRPDAAKPAVFFLGGVHANEWGSADILVYFVLRILGAYHASTGLTFGNHTFTAAEIQDVLDTLDIIVFPQANPDGRNESMKGDPTWRKNRRTSAPNSNACPGVDINRNFDFLWDFDTKFDPLSWVNTSTDPCDPVVYCGPAAFSEPETQNCKWIFDTFPAIAAFIDLHSWGQKILTSWGDDESQSVDASMNFLNPLYDGQRGVEGDAYREYLPSTDRSQVSAFAGALRKGIHAVRGITYSIQPAIYLYPASGASQDYAYSRHFVDPTKNNVIAFTLEWGRTPDPPPYAEMTNIIQDITCGLLAFCLELCAKENAMAWQTKGNGATNPTTDFLGTTDNEPVVIKTSSSEALRITSTGNVGIGIATPNAKLHVNGGAMISGVAIGQDTAGVNYSNEYETVGVSDHQYNLRLQSPNDIFLHTGSPTPTARLTIDANGNVGIGTTQPLTKLYVEDNSSTFALVSYNHGGPAFSTAGYGDTIPSVLCGSRGAAPCVAGLAFQTGTTSFGVIGTAGLSALPATFQAQLSGGVGVVGYSPSGTGVGGVSDGTGAVGNGVEGVVNGGPGAGVAGWGETAASIGVYGQSIAGGKAARFIGSVDINGTIFSSGKGFRIDHPLDPARKYLNHSSVESPEMLTVYNGVVSTGDDGHATVKLPDYFGALNRDFTYQLTVIGEFAQAIIAREIEDNAFAIRTDRPRIKVSWQVTGVRRDAYANAHRLPVEQEKPAAERGHYLHPDLYKSGTTPIGYVKSMFGSSA